MAVGCGDSGVVYEEGGEGDLTLNGVLPLDVLASAIQNLKILKNLHL